MLLVRLRRGWLILQHTKQLMGIAMLPKILFVKTYYSVNGAVRWGPLTSRSKNARLHAVYCRRIGVGDLKHGALNGLGVLIVHLRRGWYSLLHSKQSMDSATPPQLAQANNIHSINGVVKLRSPTGRYKKVRVSGRSLLEDQIVWVEALGFDGVGILLVHLRRGWQGLFVQIQAW